MNAYQMVKLTTPIVTQSDQRSHITHYVEIELKLQWLTVRAQVHPTSK